MLVLTKSHDFFSFGPVADILGWIMDLLFRFTNLFGIMNIGLEHYFIYIGNQTAFVPIDH